MILYFSTEVFEEYHRSTGEVEDAVLEMWLQGIRISQRKIAEVTAKLGAVKIGKDVCGPLAQIDAARAIASSI